MVLSWDDKLTFLLPRMDDYQAITYQDFIDLAEELERIEIHNQVECWTKKRFLLRVEFIHDERLRAVWNLARKGSNEPPRPIFLVETTWETMKYQCALVHGITPFGIAVVQNDDYEKYYPPVLEEEFFVEVRFDNQSAEKNVLMVAQAYLFELSVSAHVNLMPSPRATCEPEYWEEDEENREKEGIDSAWNQRLRPLLLGKGMAELVTLYNEGIRSQDKSIQILSFAKVMEFVSPTVVRRKITELGRLKLLSPQALDPNADFIKDLQTFFEEQRIYRQDQEAIKLTVKECCDPFELKPKAPSFLDKLCNLKTSATVKEKEQAMMQFGESLSVTRNMIVHAKSNYEMTVRECPLDQIDQFAECSKLAAERVVRWYHSQHENLRIG